MTQLNLHRTPRWRNVVLEQVRIVGLSLRREALVVAVVLVLGTIMIAGDVAGGGPGFDSHETLPTALIAFLFPFAVWKGERTFGSGFLWTLPVDRRRLALARVFAGLVWLMAALAIFLTWIFALGLLTGVAPGYHVMRVPLIAPIATYLFGSALVLGLRHPLRWLLGAAGVLFMMGILGDVISQPDDGEWHNLPGASAFFSMMGSASSTWVTLSDTAQLAITASIWCGAGLAALWAAAWRHRERRRR